MNWVSIDFGTSYSSASILIDDKPVKVHPMGGLYNTYGFPTVAYVGEDKKIKVCNEALPWRCQNPERFVKDFKLNIHEDELAYLGIRYCDIITEILKAIKQSAEYAMGNEPIEGTIITIPATYSDNDPRKNIMRDSAIAAGFKEVEFLKEAEAAAIYYDSVQKSQAGTITLIYDLGGGTFDPALIQHTAEGYRLLGSTSGNEYGGKYFEAALYRHFKEKYTFKYDDDEAIRMQQIDGIAKLCKEIKEALSSTDKVVYPVPLMPQIMIEYSRDQFEALIKPMLEKTFQVCSSLVTTAGKKWSDVNRILMIGGSTAIPCVRKYLKQYLIGQNSPDIPIVMNKSEEGYLIDTLFAVSIGGILYHHVKTADNATEHQDSGNSIVCWRDKGVAYRDGVDVEKNWIKAAYCFNKDFSLNQNEASFTELMKIYQFVLDKLEIENGNLVFQPIVDTVGQDAVDSLIDILLYLQSDMTTKGYDSFIQDIFDVDYWISITDSIIKDMQG